MAMYLTFFLIAAAGAFVGLVASAILTNGVRADLEAKIFDKDSKIFEMKAQVSKLRLQLSEASAVVDNLMSKVAEQNGTIDIQENQLDHANKLCKEFREQREILLAKLQNKQTVVDVLRAKYETKKAKVA